MFSSINSVIPCISTSVGLISKVRDFTGPLQVISDTGGEEGRSPLHPMPSDDLEGEMKDAVTHSVLTSVGVSSSLL